MSLVCVDDFEQHAKRFLPKMYWQYYSGGTDANISLQESKNAFKRYLIAPVNKECILVFDCSIFYKIIKVVLGSSFKEVWSET